MAFFIVRLKATLLSNCKAIYSARILGSPYGLAISIKVIRSLRSPEDNIFCTFNFNCSIP
ncbi:hypothetical protein Mapa_018748 [Marchantia paleacea]|nr:hypothetical protein Mapa_018748 [Marchantia paleacea]